MRLAGGAALYAYVHDPLAWLDPLGLSQKCMSSGKPKPARITPGSLPAEEEAALLATLRHIDAGTVPTGKTKKKWGTTFHNKGGDLPGTAGSGGYKEYRVSPAPGEAGAGARRIVVDDADGSAYYTWTHYSDSGSPAFVQIR